MKRVGNLYQKIAELDNLELAFWKAQRGKSAKKSVILFRENLMENLLSIRKEFLENNVRMGDYHYFTIHDPKERRICAAAFRERVIHHAVVNVCGEVFGRYQIYDSYASIKGKGIDLCLDRAVYFCSRYKWFLKLDIHKCYDSINHNKLINILNSRFKDGELLNFFMKLLKTYEISPDKGIPIGNLLSQYFANMHLAVMDHEIKDRMRIKGYLRYMDDCLFFSDDKTELAELKIKVKDFVKSRLDLEINKPQLNRCVCGIPFLSYRVTPNGLRLSLKAKRRFKKKIKNANETQNLNKVFALLSFVNRAESLEFRKKVLKVVCP